MTWSMQHVLCFLGVSIASVSFSATPKTQTAPSPAIVSATQPAGSRPADRAPYLDDMDAPASWTGPIYQYGNTASGNAWFHNGILTIRREPVAKWHTVSMRKTWPVAPQNGFWVHVCFRIEEMLLGADLYVTIHLE